MCDFSFSAQSFDAAVYFDTVPELLSRTYNRPKKETLKNNLIQAPGAQAIKVKSTAAKTWGKGAKSCVKRDKRKPRSQGRCS